MLSNRFKNNGQNLFNLNDLQLSIKSKIEDEIKQGKYFFESFPCVVCEGKDFELLSEKDRYGLYMPVKICKFCGLVQTNPRMSESSYESFYRTEQKKLYVGKEEPDSIYFEKQYKRGSEIYSYLKDFIDVEYLKVLEVGCSSGGILQYFKEKGNSVFGFDLNKFYIDYGVNQGLHLQVATLDTISLPWEPDIVIYSHTLEHILDPVKELMKLKQLCNKAYLYVELPGIKNLRNSYNQDFLEYLQNAHVFHFSLRTLRNTLSSAGWTLIKGDEYIRSIFSPSDSCFFESDYIDALSFLKGLENENFSF